MASALSLAIAKEHESVDAIMSCLQITSSITYYLYLANYFDIQIL